MTTSIEYRIGGIWHLAATFAAADLAEIALRAFKRAQPFLEWRMA
jgi:ubiquinone biosynthesis protein Coq4